MRSCASRPIRRGRRAMFWRTNSQVLVLGPGLGRSQATTTFVEELLSRRSHESALVIDADGLFALSQIPGWHAKLGPNTILTPHAGELRRLADTQADAVPTWVEAGRLASQWGCVLVAKGPFTSVACPDGRVDVWPHANAALATGGTGDVLAGMCGGLLAQGCAPDDAARLAVVAHALSCRATHSSAWLAHIAGQRSVRSNPRGAAGIGRRYSAPIASTFHSPISSGRPLSP